MAENKTRPSDIGVNDFINRIENEERRRDCRTIMNIMKEVTGTKPKMWGDSIVGFGSYHYKYASGREGDWFLTGLSPRKQNLTIYLMCGLEKESTLMKKLGKFKTGKSCLYSKKLEDIDISILEKLITRAITHTAK